MNVIAAVKPFLGKCRQGIVKNASHLLMGLGTVTSLSALISAIQMAPAARSAVIDAKIDKAKGNKGIDLPRLTFWEWIQAVWKYYGPAAAMEMLALVSFWFAHGIDIRRQAVWASVAATAEEALREYQRKTKEMFGDKVEKEIRAGQAQDFVDKNPPQSTFILDSECDRQFLYKEQYFPSSYNKIKEAQNEANADMLQHMYLSEAELMWFLDPTRKYLKPEGDDFHIGYSVDSLIHLDIHWVDGPKHEPIGVIDVLDGDGRKYIPSPGFCRCE